MSTSNALFQLGMDLDAPSTAQTEELSLNVAAVPQSEQADHFIVKNGVRCAGTHLIIDLHDADRLDDLEHIEQTMLECVEKAGATLLHIHLHHFQPEGGVTGVAVLAESHISIHSWPENRYAAFDVFMCGDAKPELCVDILRNAFSAGRVVVGEHLRGRGA
ncbi:adenosylmethionine decarboxylase [Coralliovum pocilloporae]|uniref:adenosylmethionine decarboxylase n=1 Tax=Coralliovum pocilloporae TaxID=3066369 RepID=UPI003307A30B